MITLEHASFGEHCHIRAGMPGAKAQSIFGAGVFGDSPRPHFLWKGVEASSIEICREKEIGGEILLSWLGSFLNTKYNLF